ncbi:MAG: (2Fe-2S) ferredoxin domain-containing protein, partial [Acidobacteria bacterium]|nr:(2Fe-2S) ferredoxin domain-containing protein [Acidobacteriota bacterium]
MAYRSHILICSGTGCVSCGAFTLKEQLLIELEKNGLSEQIQVVTTGCQGFCAEGPIMIVQPDGIFYCQVKPSDIPTIVQEHLIKGRPVKKLLYSPPDKKMPIPALNDIP